MKQSAVSKDIRHESGPTAEKLTDEWGSPPKPKNLRHVRKQANGRVAIRYLFPMTLIYMNIMNFNIHEHNEFHRFIELGKTTPLESE